MDTLVLKPDEAAILRYKIDRLKRIGFKKCDQSAKEHLQEIIELYEDPSLPEMNNVQLSDYQFDLQEVIIRNFRFQFIN